MTIRVREATPADAEEMGVFHVRAWQDAYRDQMPAEYLAGLDPAPRGAQWLRSIEEPFPKGGVRVAVDGHRIVGLVSYAAALDDDVAGAGAIYALYAAAEYWGRGVGPALHDTALGALTAEGFTEAVLWVLAGNARAIRFYERNGWRPDGSTRTDTVWSLVVDEVRYRRPL